MDAVAQFPVPPGGHRWEVEKTWKSRGRGGYPRKWMTLWRCVRCENRKRIPHMVNRREVGPLDAPSNLQVFYVNQKPYGCGELLVREVMES